MQTVSTNVTSMVIKNKRENPYYKYILCSEYESF